MKEKIYEFYLVQGTGYVVVEVSATSRKAAELKARKEHGDGAIIIYRGTKK